MDTKLPYWGSLVFSTVALVLLIVNISLANTNRTAQAEVQQRQLMISNGQTYAQINQGLLQALAEGAKGGDTPMRELLASQGLTLKDKPAAPGEDKTSEKKGK